jgi:hypothetical protein
MVITYHIADWKSDGCSRVESDPAAPVQCTCNHLTNFAILAVSISYGLCIYFDHYHIYYTFQNINPVVCDGNRQVPNNDFTNCIGEIFIRVLVTILLLLL